VRQFSAGYATDHGQPKFHEGQPTVTTIEFQPAPLYW
jgi:hypothetical protein